MSDTWSPSERRQSALRRPPPVLPICCCQTAALHLPSPVRYGLLMRNDRVHPSKVSADGFVRRFRNHWLHPHSTRHIDFKRDYSCSLYSRSRRVDFLCKKCRKPKKIS